MGNVVADEKKKEDSGLNRVTSEFEVPSEMKKAVLEFSRYRAKSKSAMINMHLVIDMKGHMAVPLAENICTFDVTR